MRISRRAIALSLLVSLLGVAALVLVTRPQAGSLAEDGPQGTLALTRLLGGLELGGERGDPPADGGTFLLLRDVRGERDVADLLSWVESGGRLVVADPTSMVLDDLGVEQLGRISGTVLGNRSLRPDCPDSEALVGVGDVVVRVDDRALATTEGGTLCLRTTSEAGWMVEHVRGAGTVIVTGGRSPFTNGLLRDGDNAAFVVRLLGGTGPGRHVVQGAPIPLGTSETTTFWAALPLRVQVTLSGLALALVTYALVRGRRLGWPPDEVLPSPIPASALVGATAELYRSSGDRDHVASLLRDHARRDLCRRVGLDPTAPTELLVQTVATATDLPPTDVRARLDGPRPTTDEALVHLGRELDDLRTRIGGSL